MPVELSILHTVSLILAGLVMIWAAGSDAARFRIPNMACLALLALFPLFAATHPTTLPWIEHIAVFALVLAIGYGLYLKQWAGAGDIKLIAVIALWAGPAFAMTFLFITAMAGGVLSVGIALTTLVRQRMTNTLNPAEIRKTPIPYGLAIAVGGLCTLALLSHPDLLVGG